MPAHLQHPHVGALAGAPQAGCNVLNTLCCVACVAQYMHGWLVADICEWYPCDLAELITPKGYPAQRHKVMTRDGFILTIFRIPYGKLDAPQTLQPS